MKEVKTQEGDGHRFLFNPPPCQRLSLHWASCTWGQSPRWVKVGTVSSTQRQAPPHPREFLSSPDSTLSSDFKKKLIHIINSVQKI